MDIKAKLFLGISLLFFVLAVGYSFFNFGNPWHAQAIMHDQQRSDHLSSLKSSVDSFYMRLHQLPAKIEDLNVYVSDPTTHKPYEYFVDTETDYRLCATFESNTYSPPQDVQPKTSSIDSMGTTNYFHSTGHTCFTYSVAPSSPTFAPLPPSSQSAHPDKLIAHWSFTDSPTDKKYSDSSGNNYTATSATVLNRTSRLSASDAIEFSGTERINLGNLPATPQGTLMIWVKPYQSHQPESVYYPFYGAGGFLGRQIPETSSSLIFSFKSSDSLIPMFLLGNRPSVNTTGLTAKTELKPNTWNHLAATWNITDSRVTIYVNGIQEGEKTDINPDTGGGEVDLGSVRNNMSKFIGAIGDFYYFGRELNGEEIASYAGR